MTRHRRKSTLKEAPEATTVSAGEAGLVEAVA